MRRKMAGQRERLPNEEYDRKHGIYDDRSGFGRQDDEADGLAVSQDQQSRRDRAWRFNNLTDFLE